MMKHDWAKDGASSAILKKLWSKSTTEQRQNLAQKLIHLIFKKTILVILILFNITASQVQIQN